MVAAPFARLLANLVVMGTGVLGRAFLQAYKQALAGGGTAAAGKAAVRGGVAEAEARQILNVTKKATETEIVQARARAQTIRRCLGRLRPLALTKWAPFPTETLLPYVPCAGARHSARDERPCQRRVGLFAEQDLERARRPGRDQSGASQGAAGRCECECEQGRRWLG